MKTQKALGEKIGLSFDKNRQNTIKVVIVSPQHEIIYEMSSNLEHIKKPLSLGQSISRFVSTFHSNPSELIPLRISKKLQANNRQSEDSDSDISNNDNCDKSGKSSCIHEINGEIFDRFVMEEASNKNVILLYKTSACAFCTAASSAAHVFHTVRRLFR